MAIDKSLIFRSLALLLLVAKSWGDSGPEVPNAVPGPDVIVGDLPNLEQFGATGSQVGLMMGTEVCNNGDAQVNWFRLPETDHPAMPQNLYRMSGGTTNAERFEQVGQSWVKHHYFPLQQNACGFGCAPSPDSAHLGVGCSTPDTASVNASQPGLGSRAWVNPFTGIFPSTSGNHTGHIHDGVSHRILVEANDLIPTMNPGATYYGEAQLVTPHEYAWCQSHPGQCNMFNNVSYRQFAPTGTTDFTFSAVGPTVRMTPAIFAWPGATIQTIEPAPGIDGRAYLAYKVTQRSATSFHYEYAIYNQNLDRGIQSFSAPAGCGIGGAVNLGFQAPLNHPGFADDGTVGNAGYSNAPWTMLVGNSTAFWFTETFAQNPNANALRWGTLYTFRFDGGAPMSGTATIGFFKTGAPITIQVPGPIPECAPSPTPPPPTPSPTATPTPTPTPAPSATPTATAPPPTPTATATPSPTPTPTPSPAQALNLSTRMLVETGNNVLISGFIISGGADKTVVLRGIGPSLATWPFPNPMVDPTLELRAANGLLLSQNDNWQDDSAQAAQLTTLGLAPGHGNEPALIATLQPGAYTAILAGKNQGTGVGIGEIYDVSSASGSQLANISTRGFVRASDNRMIGGFILGGNNGTTRVVVRGIGPSLAQFGLSPVLADPTLELRDRNGAIIVSNDNWLDDPVSAAQLSAAGFALSDPKESGIFAFLPPDRFTAILAGKNGGIGIGLIEIYNLR